MNGGVFETYETAQMKGDRQSGLACESSLVLP